MTIGEFEIFIGNVVNWIGDYITRLLLTLFGQIPWDDVVIFDIILLIVIGLWVIGFIITIMESIIETIRGAIKSIINFIKYKMFKLKTYRDLLAIFIHLIFSTLAYVIVYWVGYSTIVLFPLILVIILDEGSENIYCLIMIFSLLYGILIYFKTIIFYIWKK